MQKDFKNWNNRKSISRNGGAVPADAFSPDQIPSVEFRAGLGARVEHSRSVVSNYNAIKSESTLASPPIQLDKKLVKIMISYFDKMKKQNNYAFIDSQNINLGIQTLGWKLDWRRFRVYLQDKYKISKAYIFIGYKAGNESLYSFLQDAGYHCIFKPTLELPSGQVKGNCDAELVLHTMIQLNNFEKALIASGDGDFYCLIEFLIKENKLLKVLVPDERRYSSLLNRLSGESDKIIDSMNLLEGKLKYQGRNSGKRKGLSSGRNP